MESPTQTALPSSVPTNLPQAREATTPLAARRAGQVDLHALIERARGGDSEAFAALVSEARPRALAVALKVLRNPDDAEDAVQDAFLKVWRYLARFEGRSSVTTWIHRIVMNASLDLLRRQSCRPETLVDEADSEERRPVEASHDVTPERTLDEAETGLLVRQALLVLSPPHREALTLRELEDHSYDEIAQIARCPVGTVMSRLHHARRRLADELRPAMQQALAA